MLHLELPAVYLRYIDIFGVWTHGADSLKTYHALVNPFHPSLTFPLEQSSADKISSVPFLDSLITVKPTGQYETELYFKPMASPIIVHFTSAQPMLVKLAVLHSELTRAKIIGYSDDVIQRGTQKVKDIFLENGYPLRIIKRAVMELSGRPAGARVLALRATRAGVHT